MTPASKGTQVKTGACVAASAADSQRHGAGNKELAARVGATATKRPALTKKKAAARCEEGSHRDQEGRLAGQEGGVRGHEEGRAAAAKKAGAAPKKAAPARQEDGARRPRRRRRAKKARRRQDGGTKKARRQEGRAAKKAPATAERRRRRRRRRARPSRPSPSRPPRCGPKTGPYAKDAKFLDEVRELLLADRAIYQEQATSLRAEADSLALEREPGDVQFDEESGEGGTVTVDRERNLALSGQATLAVEEIDDALVRIDGQDLRLLRAVLPADPQAAPAGAALRPALRGLQERGAVAALTRPRVAGVRHRRGRGGGRPGDDDARRRPPPRRAPRLGPVRAGPDLQLGLRLQPLQRAGRRVTVLLCVGVVVLAVVVAQVRTVPLAVGAGLVLGGAVGNLSERHRRRATAARCPTSSRSSTGRRSTWPTPASRSAWSS